MKEFKFEFLDPITITDKEIRAIATDDCGEGWSSPCPQLYISAGNNLKISFIGSKNIEKLKELCEYALSKGKGII